MNKLLQISITALIFFSFSDINAQTKFPESRPELGYNLSEVHARVAMPLNGVSRIWIKGTENFSTASITNSEGATIETISLKPPFFTTTYSTDLKEGYVQFCNSEGDCLLTEKLYPNYSNEIGDKNFSILLYGCYEPFMVDTSEDIPKAKVFTGENNSSFRLRELFKNIALHQNFKFNDSIKFGKDYKYNGTKDSTLLRHAPKLIVTTGDQVYVDAGYGTKVRGRENHPLSAWQTKRRPYPFNSSKSQYASHLNKLYNASYSFDQLETAHRFLPTVATIDDHELRDGWGSQGDEYDDMGMNAELSAFYQLGKAAFIDHQLALSTYPQESYRTIRDTINSMHYAFKVEGKNGFVLDLRSARNINTNSVLGEAQWNDFESWLNGLEDNQEVIIVTSIPLTLRPLKLFENIMKFFKPELRDDVRDGWSYRKNIEERDRLISLLTKHRTTRNIKPIFVSGDVHKSALIEIWVDTYADRDGSHDMLETMILGYEVVASGLTHEFIKTGLSKSLFKITESQRIGDGFIEFEYEGNSASLYPMVRNSTVSQNFGAIEFSENEKTRLHTFIYDNDEDAINQYYLELDFDKKLPDEDYFIYERKSNGRYKQEFVAPVPHGKRKIEE